MKIETICVTKERADATLVKTECLLLQVGGKYYYGETFNRLIEIQEWEYHRILNNPYLYYFSTALKKQGEWRIANREGTTLTFAEALGYSNELKGKNAKANRKGPEKSESAKQLTLWYALSGRVECFW
jgi:hypothetical protein